MMVPVRRPTFHCPAGIDIGWKALNTGIFGASPVRAFVHKACAACRSEDRHL